MKSNRTAELSENRERNSGLKRPLFIYDTISVHTEITETQSPREWVFYDGSCRYCTATAKFFEPALRRRGIGIAPLQAEWSLERLNIGLDEALEEMRFQDSTGRIYGGADAAVQLARRIWWCLPVFWLSFPPGVMPLLRRGYSRLAAWRSCTSFGRCRIQHRSPSSNRLGDWVPLFVLPLAAAILGWHWPNWVFMWAMAFAIYFGSKWLTLRRAVRSRGRRDLRLELGYFFGWPGMDTRSFLGGGEPPGSANTLWNHERIGARGIPSPPMEERARERRPFSPVRGKRSVAKNAEQPGSPLLPWLAAGACLCFGVALVLDAARNAGVISNLLIGWEGMIGVVLVLHFGVFKVVSLLWELNGVKAEPVMRAPMLSNSVSEFWGSRWNTAFNSLVHQVAFVPLTRHAGAKAALLFVFLISGLLHELVISLPARGGFGLPTIYFLIQGLGMALERSRWGRSAGLGRGGIGRLFVFAVVAGPVFWLFHPPFVNRVILPMLKAIGPI